MERLCPFSRFTEEEGRRSRLCVVAFSVVVSWRVSCLGVVGRWDDCKQIFSRYFLGASLSHEYEVYARTRDPVGGKASRRPAYASQLT